MISIIRPPIVNIDHFKNVDLLQTINVVMLIGIVAIASYFIACFASKRFTGNKKHAVIAMIALSVPATVALICFFGCAATTIKGIIFFLTLLYCSYSDIKKRECDDFPHILIVVAAFIGTELTALPLMLVSAIFTGGLLLVPVLFGNNCNIGGADIKCAMASAFLLGIQRSTIGLVIGLFIAIAFNIFKSKEQRIKGFPMLPYLTVGYFTSFLLIGG